MVPEDIAKELNVVDFFFVGIDMEGKTASLFEYGIQRADYSNVERYERLLGAIDSVKFSLMTRVQLIRKGE